MRNWTPADEDLIKSLAEAILRKAACTLQGLGAAADRGLRQVATAQKLASYNVNKAMRTLQEASRGTNHDGHKTPGQF
jgi:hypothetical protein